MRFNKSTAPILLQSKNGESGAVCLGMLLGHFGAFPNLTEIKIACDVGDDEILPENLLKSAEQAGLDAELLEWSYGEIKEDDLPLMIYGSNSKYFLLVRKQGDKFIIHDPEKGKQSLSSKEFEAAYDAGELDLGRPEVVHLVMLLPFARHRAARHRPPVQGRPGRPPELARQYHLVPLPPHRRSRPRTARLALASGHQPHPHLHASAGPINRRVHVPTGRVSLESVIRLLLGDLQVPATRERAADSTQVLDECEAPFIEHRRWHAWRRL